LLPADPFLQLGNWFVALNDGMAWALFPLVFAVANLSVDRIGILAAITGASGLVAAVRLRETWQHGTV